jgi:DNA-binding protein H-NS
MPRQSYETIQKQIAKLQAQAKALEAARDNKKARAVEKVRALMKKLGVSVADMTAAAPVKGRRGPAKSSAPRKAGARKSGGKVAPKFQDPASGLTWTGRGRPPKWLDQYLKQGRNREEFAIQVAQAADAPAA